MHIHLETDGITYLSTTQFILFFFVVKSKIKLTFWPAICVKKKIITYSFQDVFWNIIGSLYVCDIWSIKCEFCGWERGNWMISGFRWNDSQSYETIVFILLALCFPKLFQAFPSPYGQRRLGAFLFKWINWLTLIQCKYNSPCLGIKPNICIQIWGFIWICSGWNE